MFLKIKIISIIPIRRGANKEEKTPLLLFRVLTITTDLSPLFGEVGAKFGG
jgi:hypothetical protein